MVGNFRHPLLLGVVFAALLNPQHPAVSVVQASFNRHVTAARPARGGGGFGLGGGGPKVYGKIMGSAPVLKLKQLEANMVDIVSVALCTPLLADESRAAMHVFLAPTAKLLEHELCLALKHVQHQIGESGNSTFVPKVRRSISQEYEKNYTNSIALVAQPRNSLHGQLMAEFGFRELGIAASLRIQCYETKHYLNLVAYGTKADSKLYLTGKVAGVPPNAWMVAKGKTLAIWTSQLVV